MKEIIKLKFILSLIFCVLILSGCSQVDNSQVSSNRAYLVKESIVNTESMSQSKKTSGNSVTSKDVEKDNLDSSENKKSLDMQPLDFISSNNEINSEILAIDKLISTGAELKDTTQLAIKMLEKQIIENSEYYEFKRLAKLLINNKSKQIELIDTSIGILNNIKRELTNLLNTGVTTSESIDALYFSFAEVDKKIDNNNIEGENLSLKVIAERDKQIANVDTVKCLIKGNIGYNTGEKIYHLPGCEYYDATTIDERYGEKWFCTEKEAINAGWRKAYTCP